MKKNMEPTFDAVWWDRNQPKGLKSARALHAVLTAYEKARDMAKRTGGAADVKAAEEALDKIDSAVSGVIDEAKKLAKTPPKGSDAEEFDATATVLKKYDRLYATERAALAKMVTGDEEDDSAFADPAEYRKYLLKGLRRIKPDDPMNFGIALGTKKTDHRMALSRSKAPMGLARMAREMTGLTMVTFGTIYEDPEDAGTLLLALEGKQLPGLKKKAERMLKQYKPLPYMRVRLLVDGAEVADLIDPGDTDTDDEEVAAPADASASRPAAAAATEPTTSPAAAGPAGASDPVQPPVTDPAQQRLAAQLGDRMKSVEPLLRQAILAHPDRRAEFLAPVAAFTRQLASGDVAAAQGSLGDLARLLAAAGPVSGSTAGPSAATAAKPAPHEQTAPASGADAAAATRPAPAYRTLIGDWATARGNAANDLRNLETAILAEFQDQPELPAIQAAVRRLDAILQTLAPDLEDKLTQAEAAAGTARDEIHKAVLEQIERYRSYVESDTLVAAVQDNPFTPVTLKATLAASLAEIEQALAA